MKTKIITVILILLSISPVQAVYHIDFTEGYNQLDTTERVEHVYVFNDAILDVVNCNLGDLTGYNNTLINWYYGDIFTFGVSDNSIANIYGGNSNKTNFNIIVGGNGTINLYDMSKDGAFLTINFYPGQNGKLNIYARDVVYTPYSNDSGGILSGQFLTEKGTSFSIRTPDDPFSHINIIPEPSTLLLLGTGCLLLRRRK